MADVVYIMEYQPSSASVRIGGGNGAFRVPRLGESDPLILLLALLGIAYVISKE